MTNHEALRVQTPEAVATFIAGLVVRNVRTVMEDNCGIVFNDVMWERYMKDQRKNIRAFLDDKEAADEKD